MSERVDINLNEFLFALLAEANTSAVDDQLCSDMSKSTCSWFMISHGGMEGIS
jgi:hypothetical protein